jgi:hypothetical protein
MGRFVSPRARASVATLAAALLLSCAGVIALTLQPQGAAADALKPEPAEFTVKPGDAKSMDFSKIMIGSADVRPTSSDDCRTSPVTGLTCASHRIKIVNRTPGYFLRISTSWVSQSAAGTSVPDVDTYLFDGPGSSFNYNEVGGVSGAMPEQIKLVNPTQDEYDLVVGAYAGAITEHSVLVEYVNSAPGVTPAPPDILLTPKGAPFREVVTSVIAGETGSPALYPVLTWAPNDCRSDPKSDVLCDVYRLKLNRSKVKGAVNFVVIELQWPATLLPDIATPAAGLGLGYFPDLDMIVWDTPDHHLERGQAGGQGDGYPERVGFVATQDEYDLVIQAGKGAVTTYTLSAFMTDELFDKPFELLDPLTGQLISQDPSQGQVPLRPSDSPADVPPLALAPIDVDDQIAGIGLGTTEQFDRDEAMRLGQEALRNVSLNSKAPSAAVLILVMGVVPLLLLGGAVIVMRRRHSTIF